MLLIISPETLGPTPPLCLMPAQTGFQKIVMTNLTYEHVTDSFSSYTARINPTIITFILV
jgi:hypothetical protein